MTKIKSKFMLLLLAAALFGGGAAFVSCEKDEAANPVQEAGNFEVELKTFGEAVKIAGRTASKPFEKREDVTKRRLSLMINEAKALIYATGVSEQELDVLYAGNDSAIVKHAMDVYFKETQKQLKK